MVELSLAISGILAILAGIILIAYPKKLKEILAVYLILIGLIRVISATI